MKIKVNRKKNNKYEAVLLEVINSAVWALAGFLLHELIYGGFWK